MLYAPTRLKINIYLEIMTMIKFSDSDIQKAAYFIWKNNGCPANTHVQDWNAAINQLNAMATIKNASKKLASAKLSSAKKNLTKAASLKVSVLKPISLKKTTTKTTSKKTTLKKSK